MLLCASIPFAQARQVAAAAGSDSKLETIKVHQLEDALKREREALAKQRAEHDAVLEANREDAVRRFGFWR